MRVLYFTRAYTPHDHRFLSALAESGQEVFYLPLENDGKVLEDRPLPPQVERLHWRSGTGRFRWRDAPARVLELRRMLRALKPDVVHAGPVQTCAFLSALAGVHPLVTMSWGSDLLRDAYSSGWMKQVTRFTLRASDVLVGDCLAVRDAAVEFGFSPENVVLFPWGVDLNRFKPAETPSALRERLGWQDAFVVLSLRSWEPIYGVETVVEAFAQAIQEEPRLRLILLGQGSLAGRIQQRLHQKQLHDVVYLGGQVNQEDLPRFYQAADLYVSASHSDGSSVSLMEALASGLPVLVSDIPGNREWVVPGEVGWLFPVDDAYTLAQGILRAVREPQTLAEMRLRARHLAEERADWRKNFPKLLDAYCMALRRVGKMVEEKQTA
ncbi:MULTISPECIES: glycosyltransferase family 4 protein [Anaerolinea]|uniref:glycosyltransferase family 4 protein n=1 Tax=Anaerolinea TaxID=233189 RepID=UPI002639D79B|nr:glycosyltransferase family 4 protein [Anaerolinea thermophila]